MKAPDKIYLHKIRDEESSGFHKMWFEQRARCVPSEEYIRKDVLIEWVESEMNRLWELLPDADNPNPTQMELRYLGQYMQMEALEDKLNSM